MDRFEVKITGIDLGIGNQRKKGRKDESQVSGMDMVDTAFAEIRNIAGEINCPLVGS